MSKQNAEARSKRVLVDDRTYEVLAVKKGGMGSVWLLKQAFDAGHDPIYRHRIAVKTFDGNAHSEQVEQELNIWISLEHPSILPLKKIGRLDYRLAAIMPWMQGSLDDTLEQRGSLSESEVALVLLRVAEALDHAWTALRILQDSMREDSQDFGMFWYRELEFFVTKMKGGVNA